MFLPPSPAPSREPAARLPYLFNRRGLIRKNAKTPGDKSPGYPRRCLGLICLRAFGPHRASPTDLCGSDFAANPLMQPDMCRCLALLASLIISTAGRADDWPQWLGPQRDGVWREEGLIEKFPVTGPPVRWRVPISAGYSGPAVSGGRVFVMDRQLSGKADPPGNAFSRGRIPGNERVVCLNEADGKLLWVHEYDCPYTVSYAAGPRTTPLISEGKVYTLGAEGNLFCLDAATGKEIWARDFKKDFGIPTPMWGFAAHPLLDGNRLICLAGGDGSVAVAF